MKIFALIWLTTLSAWAGDECGQRSNGGVAPQTKSAKQTLNQLCNGDSRDRLKQLAQSCNGPDGTNAVLQDADKYVQRQEKLCESSQAALEATAGACRENKRADQKAEEFQQKMTKVSGNDQSAAQQQLSNGSREIMPILDSVGQASGQASEKIKGEDENIGDTQKNLAKVKDSAISEDKAHGKKVSDVEKQWSACKDKTCDSQKKSEFQKARQIQNSTRRACQQLLAAKAQLDKLQDDLKEKMKKLAQSVDGLKDETDKKFKELASQSNATGKNAEQLQSSAKSGEKDPPPTGGNRTKEAWDIPPEKSGKKPPGKVGDEQDTTASWYDPSKRDSKKYPPEARTAASNYYPEGSVLEVTNTKTGQKTEVTVNDTGFFRTSDGGNAYSTNIKDFGPSRGVGIDLSRGAARDVGLEKPGMGNVIIRRIK